MIRRSSLFFVLIAVVAHPSSILQYSVTAEASNCHSNRLVRYKVIFQTHWDRKLFPRQYPEWRPPAQWSKLVGEYTTNVIIE